MQKIENAPSLAQVVNESGFLIYKDRAIPCCVEDCWVSSTVLYNWLKDEDKGLEVQAKEAGVYVKVIIVDEIVSSIVDSHID